MYSCGATILPVWPTCMSFGTNRRRPRRGKRRLGASLSARGVEDLEVVAVLHAAAAGDHDLGSGQFRTVGLGQLFADEGGLAGIGRAGNLLDGSRTAFGGDGVEAGGTR